LLVDNFVLFSTEKTPKEKPDGNERRRTPLIGEDGVPDVTIAPRPNAAAVDIGSKSWPFDIRFRPWVFRPHTGLLPLRYIAGGDVRCVATNGLESGCFQGFL
jgi:hypothetical protein